MILSELGIRLIRRNSHELIYHWEIEPDLAYLRGHFPNKPVLPGAIVLEVALSSIVQEWFKNGHHLERIKSSKFLSIIQPSEILEFVIEQKSPTHFAATFFALKEEKETVAKLQLHIRPSEVSHV